MVDDQARHTASAQIMPKLDKYLRAEGLDFVRGYVSSPVCGPARAALFKGQYPHNTGVITNSTTDEEFKVRGLDRDTVATRLKAAGYVCGHFGKYLNGYDLSDAKYVPPGWDRWFTSAEKREDHYEDPDSFAMSVATSGRETATVQRYSRSRWDETDLLADQVETFIRDNVDRKWLAYVASTAPHDPYYIAPRYKHYADGAGSHSSPGTKENTLKELSDKPQSVQGEAPWTAEEQAQADRNYEGQLAELQPVDDLIERLVLVLRETEQLPHTFVFYCSDNGYLMGEHGLLQKGLPYEEAVSVPLLVRGPGVPQGVKSEALVSQLDITATMLEVAGTKASGIDGRSMIPLLGGTVPGSWRKRLLIEQLGGTSHWDMLREGDYSYIERAPVENVPLLPRGLEDALGDILEGIGLLRGERELYNLAADPYELEDLSADSSQSDRVRALSENLAKLNNAAGAELRAVEEA
jgi:arylsulfatase A-like enzyme